MEQEELGTGWEVGKEMGWRTEVGHREALGQGTDGNRGQRWELEMGQGTKVGLQKEAGIQTKLRHMGGLR